MTRDVYVVDYVRTPIGRYGGALAGVRSDDLAAIPIAALLERAPALGAATVDDVYLGDTNQAGEDNRNVARMAALLAGLGDSVPGCTVNRLCGSGMEAISLAARSIALGEADVVIAGGVESMSRAPFVIPKAEAAYPTHAEIASTTLGWRLVNPRMTDLGHTDALGVTAENVAAECGVSREDQDAFALRSQQRAARAAAEGKLADETVAVPAPVEGQEPLLVSDEHPRPETRAEHLARLRPAFVAGGTVTAGNSSGINDGAAALLLMDADSARRHELAVLGRWLGTAVAGVPPRVMGLGPVPATEKLMGRLHLSVRDFGVIELNEAFASQALAALRLLGIDDDAEHVNPNGGAIALGHPTGMSGARLVGTALLEARRRGSRRALATMCIGVGQGISSAWELC